MTIVASVKTRDCLVIGADSLSTQVGPGPNGQLSVVKSYPHTPKVFQLSGHPIGIATWGAGNIGARSTGGLVGEFAGGLQTRPPTIQAAATSLDGFISTIYNQQFSALPQAQQPVLGFWVGGYSTRSPLPELWEVIYPQTSRVNRIIGPNDFLGAWNGIVNPFFRLERGYDIRLEGRLRQLGVAQPVITQALQGLELNVIIDSMPVQQAIEYCRYILNTSIGFTKFEAGVQLAGEPLQVAVITQRNGFRWVDELSFHE